MKICSRPSEYREIDSWTIAEMSNQYLPVMTMKPGEEKFIGKIWHDGLRKMYDIDLDDPNEYGIILKRVDAINFVIEVIRYAGEKVKMVIA